MEFDFKKKPGQRLVKECKKEILTPKVTIVTPFYNSGQHFEETYRCVINQTFEDFEWIIVNDGSTREADVAELERLVKTDVRIRVLHQKNGGQSKAKNYAIRESKTDIIIFLDADDLIEAFYVEYLYDALEKHPGAGWSYMDVAGFGAVEYVWCKQFSAGRMTFNNILVNSAAFRKSCLEEVGCFSEVEKYYDEDWALYLKLLTNKIHPVHIPMIGFWYRKSQSGMQQTVRKNKELREASDRYMEELAKGIRLPIECEYYTGELPKEAVKSEYGKADALIAAICRSRIGSYLMKQIYKIRK